MGIADAAERGKYRKPEGSKTWEHLAVLTCSLMCGCIGCIIGWNSPSIVKLLADDSPIKVTASGISTLAATVSVGHMLAPPFNTLLVDRIGRKYTILASGLPLLLSWALITIASSIWELYVARFMSGLSLGLFICVAPMYIGEVSSPETRGAGSSAMAIVYNLGILATFVIVPYLSLAMMAGVFLIVTIGVMAVFSFMPESPYFLAMKNRTDEAEEVLEKLRGKNEVSEELETILDSVRSSAEESADGQRKIGSMKAVFTVPGNLRAFTIITLFTVTHHFGGFFTILTYGQLIFRATSNTLVSDYTLNVILGVMQVISSLVTGFLVDRLGRRPLILWAGITAALCNLVTGLFFLAKEYLHADVSGYAWLPFLSSIVMVLAFNCGLICLQVILMSEIFATEIKAVGICLVGVAGGVLATLGVKMYIWIAITLDYGHSPPFLGFFVIVAVCTLAIFRLTPETKGKTFAEIQRKLNE